MKFNSLDNPKQKLVQYSSFSTRSRKKKQPNIKCAITYRQGITKTHLHFSMRALKFTDVLKTKTKTINGYFSFSVFHCKACFLQVKTNVKEIKLTNDLQFFLDIVHLYHIHIRVSLGLVWAKVKSIAITFVFAQFKCGLTGDIVGNSVWFSFAMKLNSLI